MTSYWSCKRYSTELFTYHSWETLWDEHVQSVRSQFHSLVTLNISASKWRNALFFQVRLWGIIILPAVDSSLSNLRLKKLFYSDQTDKLKATLKWIWDKVNFIAIFINTISHLHCQFCIILQELSEQPKGQKRQIYTPLLFPWFLTLALFWSIAIPKRIHLNLYSSSTWRHVFA